MQPLRMRCLPHLHSQGKRFIGERMEEQKSDITKQMSSAPILSPTRDCATTLATPASGTPTDKLVAWSTRLLRRHPAFDQIGWQDIEDLNCAANYSHVIHEPPRVTKQGIVLSGIGELQLSDFERKPYVHCIEYDLDNNQALEFILARSGPRKGLNPFIRICLALTLEEHLRGKGRENMSAAVKHKGLTNSPNLTAIDVRQSIAQIAGTGTGNVDKVRAILQNSHPNIIHALQNGSLRIYRAWTWCKLSKTDQLKAFHEFEETLSKRKTARKINRTGLHASITTQQILQLMERFETLHPGQLRIRRTARRETVIYIADDVMNAIESEELCDGFN